VVPPPLWTDEQRSSTTSGAPFMNASVRPSGMVWIVVIRLRSELNGNSSIRGALLRVSSALKPPFDATTTSAPSVGSPFTKSRAPSWPITASLASTPACSSRRNAGSSAGPPIVPSEA
jgi:hypothetical protein